MTKFIVNTTKGEHEQGPLIVYALHFMQTCMDLSFHLGLTE